VAVRACLGEVLRDTGRPAEAEAEFRAGLVIYRKLAEDRPVTPDLHASGAMIDSHLCAVLRRLGRPAEAYEYSERAVAAFEALTRAAPMKPSLRSGLAGSCLNRGLARRALGDLAGAAADIRRAVALCDALQSRSVREWFLAACAHAALAGLAGQAGAGISAAEGEEAATRAMGLLDRAVAMGYRNAAAYRTEDALDPLRGRDDFRLHLLDLALPAEPFADPR
jgi:hypothetical protein